MIGIEIQGLEETIDALQALPTVIDRGQVFSQVSTQFKQKLTAVTPAGYSGKLQRSVIDEVSDEQAVVGYEAGVEKAGNPKLDSVTRPRTRGRSVLWVRVEDLEDLATQEFEDFEDTAVSVMESAFLEQLNARP
jgi:hypothetical protein